LTEVSGLDGEPQGMALRDYVRVIVRRLWLIGLIVVVVAGAAVTTMVPVIWACTRQ